MKIAGAYLICPRCNNIVVCSCDTCRNARKQAGIEGKYKEEIRIYNGEGIKCPYCGFKAHLDWWETFTNDYVLKQKRS